jgi:hypothetical protein
MTNGRWIAGFSRQKIKRTDPNQIYLKKLRASTGGKPNQARLAGPSELRSRRALTHTMLSYSKFRDGRGRCELPEKMLLL